MEMLTKIPNVLLFNTWEIQGHDGMTVLSVGEIQSSGESHSPPREVYLSFLTSYVAGDAQIWAPKMAFYVYTPEKM